MNEIVAENNHGIFCDKKDTARVSSLAIAKVFEKRHDNVLTDIKKLDCSDNFRLLNFQESYYKNEQGKKQPCYNMTRDGFTFLAMGYRGKKASQFKEAYIAQFNQMEKFIRTLVVARREFPLLTENIKMIHDKPRPYHFSNECDLLNRLVIGVTAKQFRLANNIPKGESIRPYLNARQIEMLDILQKIDIGLLISVPDYEQRKRHLEWYMHKVICAKESA